MRLHRNLVLAVVDGLHLIFNEGKYADKVVQGLLKRDKRWGSRDRGFIAETLYELVRYQRLYAKIADASPEYSREDFYRMFAVWAVLRGIALPDWPMFAGTPVRRIKGKFDALNKERVYRESIPDWMDQLAIEGLGEARWKKEISALNQQAEVFLRTNTLKTSRAELKEALANEGYTTAEVNELKAALRLEGRDNLFRTKAFKSGWFEIQDAASQQVAPFLEVAPGMRVIDACAGAGGKSLHLAQLMENKGQLLALDIYPGKLNELKKRAKRNGVFNLEPRLITSAKTIKRLQNKADRLLLDVPCSGLGVLRRNPDAKWKLQPQFIEKLRQTQADILYGYSSMLKNGGIMVYATCSILPQENQEQVTRFLESERGANFELLESRTLFPSETGYDGFFLAKFRKKA